MALMNILCNSKQPSCEDILLSSCINLYDKEVASNLLSHLDWSGLNWEHLFKTAFRNRIAPLLYHFLRRNNYLVKTPRPYDEYLRQSYYHSLERGIRMQEAYSKISDILKPAGIPHCPLRGIKWVNTIYDKNPALRPMEDIDIFIPPSFKQEVYNLLLSDGYRLKAPVLSRGHHDTYVKHTIIIEVHTRLFIEGITALFRDFEVGESIEKVLRLDDRPVAALHYWIHRKRPAIRICDFVRLKSNLYDDSSEELNWILNQTWNLISKACNGETHRLFYKPENYYLFWTPFVLKTTISKFIKNPVRSISQIRKIGDIVPKLLE